MIIYEKDITYSLDKSIREELVRCFPHSAEVFRRTRYFRGAVPRYSVILLDNVKIIAHLGVIERIITIGRGWYRVAGIQNVFVIPTYRGFGLSNILLGTAIQHANTENFDCGLLFTNYKVKPVYSRNGWIEIIDRKFVKSDGGEAINFSVNSVQMFFPLKIVNLPDGDINLNGSDW